MKKNSFRNFKFNWGPKIYGNFGIECIVHIGFCITNHFQKNTNYISDFQKKKIHLGTSNLIEVQKSMDILV
jgi:hypothetical protein